MTEDKLLDTTETALFLGISKHTLYQWRHAHFGPDHLAISATHVKYRRSDLTKWLEARRVANSQNDEAEMRAALLKKRKAQSAKKAGAAVHA